MLLNSVNSKIVVIYTASIVQCALLVRILSVDISILSWSSLSVLRLSRSG